MHFHFLSVRGQKARVKRGLARLIGPLPGDDKGVFSTTLSHEYAVAAQSFQLDRRTLFDLARQAMEYSFAGDDIRTIVQQLFKASEYVLFV